MGTRDLESRLASLEQQGLRRYRRIVEGPQGARLQVAGRDTLAFCSNDYLGLANHPSLVAAIAQSAQQYGVGAGASALISGHSRLHEQLENRLAEFVGAPRALHFSTGYMANLGIVPALVGREGTVFCDRLDHACLIDAARLSGAQFEVYPHCDLAALERRLSRCTTSERLVATDAVFSMDGDIAPIAGLVALCDRYDAWLVLDDAHGFGVLGEHGRGSLEHAGIPFSARVVYMGTLGKAVGVAGAFVAATDDVIEWLLQTARPYIFSTASPPILAAAVLASLELIACEDWRRERIRELSLQLDEGLSGLPWKLLPSQSAIRPLVIGDNLLAVRVMEALLARGIWVPAIRPPTVPKGTARLRISISAAHSSNDVARLIEALHGVAHECDD